MPHVPLNLETLRIIGPYALAMAFVVLLPAIVYGRRWAARPARVLALTIAGLSLLGLLLKVTPWLWQVNAPIIALALPANLALAWAMWRLTERGV